MSFKGILAQKYKSPAAMLANFRKFRKRKRREDRCCFFLCMVCNTGFHAAPRCRIKEVYCISCGLKMLRARGFFCDIKPNVRRCDGCGCCDTGTDADFDRYAVQVQNGEGYYDAAGNYQSYGGDYDD